MMTWESFWSKQEIAPLLTVSQLAHGHCAMLIQSIYPINAIDTLLIKILLKVVHVQEDKYHRATRVNISIDQQQHLNLLIWVEVIEHIYQASFLLFSASFGTF